MREAWLSMGFRNDLDAAHARAAALETEVEELAASSAADAEELAEVRDQLAAAKREVAALSVHLPGSAARRAAPYRTVIFVALGLAVATAVAGYHSETVGVSMSYLAAAALGAGVAGWLGARRSKLLGLALAIGGALATLAMLFVFYAAIWPSL
jgi:hypothetical protein